MEKYYMFTLVVSRCAARPDTRKNALFKELHK